jgi:hypothetical protein
MEEEEKKHVPKFSLFFFSFFFGTFLSFSAHRERAKKRSPVRKKEEHRRRTRDAQKKKSVCSTGGSNPGPFAYDVMYTRVFLVPTILGERSDQLFFQCYVGWSFNWKKPT